MPDRRAFLQSMAAASGLIPSPALQPRAIAGRLPGEQREVAGLTFRWCPPGTFVMGSPPDDPHHRADDAQVAVTLTRGCWMGQHEVTQRQWTQVVGAFPAEPPTTRFGLGDDVPVYWVNFEEAEGFCRALTARGRRAAELADDWEIRLPTEAQWEYACRAGTTTATAFGDQLSRDQANFSGVPLNGGRDGVAHGRAVPVGSYPANAWGLCDMHGNVFEWCRDWYHARLPGGLDPDLSNVRGVLNRDGTYSRVRRGGAWNDDGQWARSARRLRYEPHRRSDHIGFRVVAVQHSARRRHSRPAVPQHFLNPRSS